MTECVRKLGIATRHLDADSNVGVAGFAAQPTLPEVEYVNCAVGMIGIVPMPAQFGHTAADAAGLLRQPSGWHTIGERRMPELARGLGGSIFGQRGQAIGGVGRLHGGGEAMPRIGLTDASAPQQQRAPIEWD